jgi:hypothetical protein
LDELLNTYYPDRDFLGLVPSLLDWLMVMDDEFRLIWDRATTKSGSTLVPILLCPDDFDLWCTVIVAEVEITDKVVKWNKLGLERTDRDLLFESINNFGQTIEWLPEIGHFMFNKTDYFRCIDKFKAMVDICEHLQPILSYEMANGNELLESSNKWSEANLLINLEKPISVKKVKRVVKKLIIENDDYYPVQKGFFCKKCKQVIAGPVE